MRCRFVAMLLLLSVSAPVNADSGATFGETARTASLARSVIGRPGDTSAIYENPAGIADLDRPTLALFGHAGQVRQRFTRTGELGITTDRAFGGYGLSLVSPLPGPEWLTHVHLGGAIHIPGDAIIRVTAPTRSDQPLSPYYDGRTQRTAATLALGMDLPFGVRLGGAVTLHPNLLAPTSVGFDPSRGETVDDGVSVSQDRILTLVPSAILGVRFQPIEEIGIGAVWRQGGATVAEGDFDVTAGAIAVSDHYRFYDFIAPEELGLGLAVNIDRRVSVSLDATWGRWSEFRTLHDERPEPGFNDVLDVRFGAEWIAHSAVRLRGGYGFLPSPVPAEIARDNYLDSHRHLISAGVGIDFEPLIALPIRLDLSARFHVLEPQHAEKNIAYFDPAIANLGYPGFTATGSLAQFSIALVVALDGARPPANQPTSLPRENPYGPTNARDDDAHVVTGDDPNDDETSVPDATGGEADEDDANIVTDDDAQVPDATDGTDGANEDDVDGANHDDDNGANEDDGDDDDDDDASDAPDLDATARPPGSP